MNFAFGLIFLLFVYLFCNSEASVCRYVAKKKHCSEQIVHLIWKRLFLPTNCNIQTLLRVDGLLCLVSVRRSMPPLWEPQHRQTSYSDTVSRHQTCRFSRNDDAFYERTARHGETVWVPLCWVTPPRGINDRCCYARHWREGVECCYGDQECCTKHGRGEQNASPPFNLHQQPYRTLIKLTSWPFYF